jgi:hypothetical protein
VSMAEFHKGAKKLRVDTASGGSLTDADISTDLVHFLPVCEVLLEIRHLRLFISSKSSSWDVDSTVVLFTEPV